MGGKRNGPVVAEKNPVEKVRKTEHEEELKRTRQESLSGFKKFVTKRIRKKTKKQLKKTKIS